MMKRAAIARAMALAPMLLFLDEPSSRLDPVTSAELDQTILKLRRILGITVVVVSHELPSIYSIADRAVLIDARTKRLAACGPPAELRDHAEDPWVRAFFRREAPPDEAEEGRP
jgi:phospholipid/cholesterol/gamma-HCH transport system ATP-binding protein